MKDVRSGLIEKVIVYSFSRARSVAQLERDLIAERVRKGLANAKAKGIRIGRLKTRDSDLNRKLKASGMTYRMMAQIARCSFGAVGAEMRAWKAEKVLQKKLEKEALEVLPRLDLGHVFSAEKCPG